MASYILSKSTYIRGMQCLKSLYLNKHRPFLRDKLSEEQLAKFSRGHSVGKLAQDLFPGGVEMPRPGDASASKTAKAIVEGIPVIYEACFIHNEVVVALDILVKHENGWMAYEVKSSGVLSETYFLDAYIQDYVIRGTGLDLKKFFLIHRNSANEINDSTPLDQLFVFTELPSSSADQNILIEDRLTHMKSTLELKNSPVITPGKQCMNPYPCDFRGICWRNLSEEEKSELLLMGRK
jgi:hypothetical protein